LFFTPSGAKDGAISPRLANRYSRFALSHRSCGDGVGSGNGNNVLKDHSWPSLDYQAGAPSKLRLGGAFDSWVMGTAHSELDAPKTFPQPIVTSDLAHGSHFVENHLSREIPSAKQLLEN